MRVLTVRVSICVALIASSVFAQIVNINSIRGNGELTFAGSFPGSTATVQWAASLTDAGRTNWNTLTNVVTAMGQSSRVDIPMFFRVLGVPEFGLAAYYPFDSTMADVATPPSVATNNGAVFSSGRAGECLSFDGSSSFAQTASMPFPSNAMTLSVWVYVNQRPPDDGVSEIAQTSVAGPIDLELFSRGTNGPLVSLYLPGMGSSLETLNIATGQWVHIAGLYDGATDRVAIYLNGVLSTNQTIPGITIQGDWNWHLGKDPDFPFYLNGLLDECRFYNRALSALEIQSLATVQ